MANAFLTSTREVCWRNCKQHLAAWNTVNHLPKLILLCFPCQMHLLYISSYDQSMWMLWPMGAPQAAFNNQGGKTSLVTLASSRISRNLRWWTPTGSAYFFARSWDICRFHFSKWKNDVPPLFVWDLWKNSIVYCFKHFCWTFEGVISKAW